MNQEKFFQRINYKGKLSGISLEICHDFKLGEFISNKLIAIGYEDFNFILKTKNNKYVVKIFSSFRTDRDCARIVDIMQKTIDRKIAIPKLLKSKQGYLCKTKVNNTKLRLCVMDFIDGKDFYRLKQKANSNEIKFLARQASLINSLEIKPKFIYDAWAITNFAKEFKKKGRYLNTKDYGKLLSLVNEFKNLNIQKLPRCFVHGDIISPNVMKDRNGKIWIIDFSVSNYYPRVQELAVLACNMFFNENNKEKSEENLKLALKEYRKNIKLTEKELKVLPVYINFAHAMHVLMANYQKMVEKNNSKENEYFLQQGRIGLRLI